jgi:hypothetical protein
MGVFLSRLPEDDLLALELPEAEWVNEEVAIPLLNREALLEHLKDCLAEVIYQAPWYDFMVKRVDH